MTAAGSDPARRRRPRAAGMPFLLCGVAFGGAGLGMHTSMYLAIGTAFIALGFAFIARARRVGRTSIH
jgi:hypothetical protein